MTSCPHITAGCGYPRGECLGACLADHPITPSKPKTLPPLIGLVGPAGCGKDTVRHMLEQDHGYTGLAFADPLRAMVAALLRHCGHDTDWMTDRTRKETDIPGLGTSYRHLAQTLGTEWAHQCLGRGFWIRCAELAMQHARERGAQRLVISDVRFPTEVAWIREQGGLLWRIHRPQVEPVRAHISESAGKLIDCDHAIDNSGTLERLWHQVYDAAMSRSHA